MNHSINSTILYYSTAVKIARHQCVFFGWIKFTFKQALAELCQAQIKFGLALQALPSEDSFSQVYLAYELACFLSRYLNFGEDWMQISQEINFSVVLQMLCGSGCGGCVLDYLEIRAKQVSNEYVGFLIKFATYCILKFPKHKMVLLYCNRTPCNGFKNTLWPIKAKHQEIV